MSMPRSRLRTGVIMLPLLLLLTLATGSIPASAQAQHLLRLHEIVCHRDFDPIGSSEPYLKVGNQRIWSGSDVDPGETHSLEGVNRWFSDSIVLVLMEDDFGPDDSLGAYQITASAANQGNLLAIFYSFTSGGQPVPNCTITYDVIG